MTAREPGPVRSIAVLGGGVAAWAAAAAFARRLPGVAVTVVADPAAPPGLADLVGATTPSVADFHADLGIAERDVMRAADAVVRLGSRFAGWTGGAPYVHTHGSHGATLAGAAFHHHWLRLRDGAGDFADYSLADALARAGRFADPAAFAPTLPPFGHGLQLDPAAYRAHLYRSAATHGAAAVPGPGRAELDPGHDRVNRIVLFDGRSLVADLYVDTRGEIADLVAPARADWSHWLPVGHLAVARGPVLPDLPPVDTVTATADGWTLTASLRRASVTAAATVARPAGGDFLAFSQGVRLAPWTGNVVAIGDAAVMLEPLEGIALHLVHAHVDRIVALLPGRDFAAVELADYNRQTLDEAARLRDFVLLHYATADRPEPLWRDLAASALPASLADDLRLWRARGYLPVHDGESFDASSWRSVLIGQGVIPRRGDPVAAELPRAAALHALGTLRAAIAAAVRGAPTHADWLVTQLEDRR